MKLARFLTILAVVTLTGCASTTLIDFDQLASISKAGGPVNVGDQFTVGDVIVHNPSGTQIIVLPYQWPNSTWTDGGYVEIVAGTQAGGAVNEVHFNNACLGVIASGAVEVKKMSVKFGDYGGNVNLIVSGQLRNESDYFALPAVLPPSIAVNVTGSLPQGVLKLDGDMQKFFFTYPAPITFPTLQYAAVVGGGQELWIDDLEFTQ